MKHAALAVAVAAAACGPEVQPTLTPAVVYSPCAPLGVTAPQEATPQQHAAVAEGLELWNALGFTRLSTGSTGRSVPVKFEKAAFFFHGFYDPKTGEVFVNTTLEEPRELAIVVAHELGHAMGLTHVDARASVMNPGNLEVPPTPDDNALLAARCR